MGESGGTWGARVEGDEDALVEDHGAVAVGHAHLAAGRLAVDDLRGGHVVGPEAGLAVKPHPCTRQVFKIRIT